MRNACRAAFVCWAVRQYRHKMTAVDVIYLFIVQRESQASHVGIIESHADIVCCTSRAELVGNFHCLGHLLYSHLVM
jgi:hypothetical protein